MDINWPDGIPFQEAIDYAESRQVVLPQDYYGRLVGVQRSVAVSIAGLAQLAQIVFVMDALNEELASGGTFADFKRKVASGETPVSLPRHRLDNIFRTNIQAAYGRGAWQKRMDNIATHPYWLYDAVNDSRTRPTHAAMDGTLLPASDPWWDKHHPLNGYRCRCNVVALTEEQALARGGATAVPDPAKTEPDAGWDYNTAADYTRWVKEAWDEAATGAIATFPRDAASVEKLRREIADQADHASASTLNNPGA